MNRLNVAVAVGVALLSAPTYADRIVCENWRTVFVEPNGTEHLVDAWSIKVSGSIRRYHYDEDMTAASEPDNEGFQFLGSSGYRAVDCQHRMYADIEAIDHQISKEKWIEIARDDLVMREYALICSLSLEERTPPSVN